MKYRFKSLISILLVVAGALTQAVALEQTACDILSTTGVRGGLVIHIGCGEGKMTAALRANQSYIIHGLDRHQVNIDAARAHIRSLGLYGPVSVDLWQCEQLPYADNTVNLALVDDAASVPMQEVVRVLTPRGVACVHRDGKWEKTVKPVNSETDEWTHYLYDASNNAVSSDRAVAPPHQLRWVGGPRWVRHHDHMSSFCAMVSAGGRLFYIIDEGMTASMQLPARWAVIARDAFNGKVLWKRRIEKWHPTMWPGKHGPAQLPRRLVADGDRLYVPLGSSAPLTALDAATGKTVRTYPRTTAAEEVLFADGMLYVVVNSKPTDFTNTSFAGLLHREMGASSWGSYPKPKKSPQEKQPFADVTGTRNIVAIDADSGQVKWTYTSPFLQLTLAVDGVRVYFHDGEHVVCLNGENGARLWASEPIERNMKMHAAFSANLVVRDGVVLFSGAENWKFGYGANDMLTALSAMTGKKLWTAPHPPSGYCSPEDTFVVNGLVWTANVTNLRAPGTFTGRDLRSGKVRIEFPGDDGNHMPHHRCYRAKATERFFLMSRTGIEFVNPETRHWDRNDWVRGSCQYGIMPANGLVYAPPHSCSCYLESKLDGLCALTATRAPEAARKSSNEVARLMRGPAFGKTLSSVLVSEATASANLHRSEDWPMYRHDRARSGSTHTCVAAALRPRWQSALGGRLSSPVVAGDRLFVASIDTHTVYALDAGSGKALWSFTAGGRVDSAPTIWQDCVVFGSADGCVYCLRTSDGALVWRLRAVPADRRIVAFEQLESQWPIHGSALIREGVVHCVAGRSMFLDGGLRYLRLDVASGKLLSENVMDDRNPRSRKELDANIRWPNLPVALPDILSCDGDHIYMRRQPFDFGGRRVEKTAPHLYSPTGFLDGGAWWHRTYWVYASAFGYGTGYKTSARRGPAGRILVMDDKKLYGFAAKPPHMYNGWSMSWWEYQLFAMDKKPAMGAAPPAEDIHFLTRGGGRLKQWPQYAWTRDIPCIVRAMVLCDDLLFVAGPPHLLDERKAIVDPDDPEIKAAAAEQQSAMLGRKGSILLAVDLKDGATRVRRDLEFAPVWDGMIAANRRLYMSTLDGSVVCFAGE